MPTHLSSHEACHSTLSPGVAVANSLGKKSRYSILFLSFKPWQWQSTMDLPQWKQNKASIVMCCRGNLPATNGSP